VLTIINLSYIIITLQSSRAGFLAPERKREKLQASSRGVKQD